MATTRLRKTFQYPDDEGSDDEPHAMDEEEQEKFIETLQTENNRKNEQWLKLFAALPLISIVAFLPALFGSTLHQRFIAILSITSLLATVYLLVSITWNRRLPSIRKSLLVPQPVPSPTQRFLPLLNGALALLIGLNGLSWRHRYGVHDTFWLLCWIPATMLLTVVTARMLVTEVDVSELKGLKYGYKGA